MDDESVGLLKRHDWPGNIRELENVLSAAAIFAEGDTITPEAFAHIAELRALLEPLAQGVLRVEGGPRIEGSSASAPVAPGAPLPMIRTVSAAPAAPLAALASAPVPTVDGAIDFFELARTRDISLKELRHEVEMQCIRRALAEAKGNISEAARLLKMKRSRLSQIVNAEGELKEVARGDDEGDDE